MNTIQYNHLPQPTWNWLHLNEAQLSMEGAFQPSEASCTVEGSSSDPGDWTGDTVSTSAGTDFHDLLVASLPEAECYAAEADHSLTLRSHLSATDTSNSTARRLDILAKAGSHVTIVSEMDGQATGILAEEIRVEAQSDAEVHIIQIIDAPASRIFSSLGVTAHERANVQVHQIVLSGIETGIGGRAMLLGDKSNLDVHLAYLCQEDHTLDINWIVPQQGKKTESQITVSGVLQGTAKKIFRGTIDFLRGSSGSKGAELEDVLLLSENVQNQTIPVILCKEEDVAGNHGASIGKLSQDLLYYMGSRGLSEDEVYKILSRSRIVSCASTIPDSTTRSKLLHRLGEDEDTDTIDDSKKEEEA